MEPTGIEALLMFILLVMVVVFAIFIIRIPIMIAKSRKIPEDKMNVISWLSWLGILFGVTWIVALVLAFLWSPNILSSDDSLGKLEKAAKLYKDKVISKAEFDKIKKELLNK